MFDIDSLKKRHAEGEALSPAEYRALDEARSDEKTRTQTPKQRIVATFEVDILAEWLKAEAEADDSDSLTANAATYLDIVTSKHYEDKPPYVLSDVTVYSPAFARKLHALLVQAQELLDGDLFTETLTALREATDMASLIAFDREGGEQL